MKDHLITTSLAAGKCLSLYDFPILSHMFIVSLIFSLKTLSDTTISLTTALTLETSKIILEMSFKMARNAFQRIPHWIRQPNLPVRIALLGSLSLACEYMGFRRGIAHEIEWRREIDRSFTQHLESTGQISFERDTIQRMKYFSNKYRQSCRDAEAARMADQIFWGLGHNIEEREGVEKIEDDKGSIWRVLRNNTDCK